MIYSPDELNNIFNTYQNKFGVKAPLVGVPDNRLDQVALECIRAINGERKADLTSIEFIPDIKNKGVMI